MSPRPAKGGEVQLDLFGECKFPGGRPGAEHPSRTYPDQPCGSASLYERHGCRGPECAWHHANKVAKQREERREARGK